MNTTEALASRLTLFAANIPINSAYRRTCTEAADRLGVLHQALGDLIEDSQHVNHNCVDTYCPVMKARQVYCLGRE